METLYERIKRLCEQNSMSVSAMCLKLGLSKSVMSDLKNGRSKGLSVSTSAKIANYFGVSVDYLLGNEQNEKPLVNEDEELMQYLQVLKTRPECRMLFQLSKNASKEDVEAAVRIIEAIRNK